MNRKLILIVLCLVLLLSACAPSPEDCVKCGMRVYGIALLNLATGESWEVEISGDRGTMSYGSYAGLSGTMNVGGRELCVTIPAGKNSLNRELFCASCREELSAAGKVSHVLLDSSGRVLPFGDSAAGGYTITAEYSEEYSSYSVEIEG